MENSIKEIIKARRSVRTYDGKPLTEDDKRKITELFAAADNPFGVPVEFRLLDAKEHKLNSPVLVGESAYVAAKVSRAPMWEVAYGYSFEKFCLDATAAGFGTVMIAGTFNRKSFEQAMALSVEGEVMPLASPVGRTAEKMSMREGLMRKAVGADKRRPFGELFFDGNFDNPLTPENAGAFADALEMVRLAPSAVNKQPWRVVLSGATVHFYKKGNLKGGEATGDLQKIDVGIALAHFDLTMREDGKSGTFVVDITHPEADGMEYIVSYKLAE